MGPTADGLPRVTEFGSTHRGLSLVLRTKDASGLRLALSGRLVDCLAVPIRLPMLSIPMP